MVNAAAAGSIGALAGAWGYPLHGAEQDSEKLVGAGVLKTLGIAGTISSFIFIMMFLTYFIKITGVTSDIKKGGDAKSPTDINKDKLSKGVRDTWYKMYYLIICTMIFGFITIVITSLLNEGFVNPVGTAGSRLLLSMFFFGLGSTAFTLALVIGMFIVEWPKTKKQKGGKNSSEVKEDAKLYKIIRPDFALGIAMSIFFLVPVITIMGSEFDENSWARKVAANQAV